MNGKRNGGDAGGSEGEHDMKHSKTERMSNGMLAVQIEQFTGKWCYRLDERKYEKRWAVLMGGKVQTFKNITQLNQATASYKDTGVLKGLKVKTPELKPGRSIKKASFLTEYSGDRCDLSEGDLMLGIARLCEANGSYRAPGHISRLGYRQGSVANGDRMLEGVVS